MPLQQERPKKPRQRAQRRKRLRRSPPPRRRQRRRKSKWLFGGLVCLSWWPWPTTDDQGPTTKDQQPRTNDNELRTDHRELVYGTQKRIRQLTKWPRLEFAAAWI